MLQRITLVLLLALLSTRLASAQTITIDGVVDKTKYDDRATFRVQTNAGFTYQVTLNGLPVPAGVSNTIARMDYYDLYVTRTDTSTLAVSNALVRFIVQSTRRGDPERGLIEWVPLPPIPSTAAEVAGARLQIIAPQDYPPGLEIPVIARVADGLDNERRVNGWVSAPGFEGSAFRLLRGHGHGFLPPATNGALVQYNAQLSALQTNKLINIDAATAWTTVSGTLAGPTTWTTNARIHVIGNLTVPAGSTLTIQEGTVVRLNPAVNITNSGTILINGTTTRPVVFTPTNRVAPEVHAGAWGGFVMRTPGAQLIANGAIMTGSGAAANFGWPSYASTHKSAQALLMLHSNSIARLTNCFLVNQAGQIGNGFNSDLTLDHCLWQRAITGGEYVGGTLIINHSAVIEFPAVDGVYNATIADADYDGIYFTTGTHILLNSLFGFAKDDAIDSGSGGAGTVVVSNCWIESALHEANAWSGGGRQTWTYDSVLMNCGQGLECGWSTGANSPLVYASNMLSLANSIGARFGDNYPGTTGLGLKTGFLTVTNSFILHNYRDIFGRVWDDTWNYRVGAMDLRNNYVTAPNTNHPLNTVWNPATDASKLAGFMTTPPSAPVGVGLGLWSLQLSVADLTNGIPVRLSSFTTNTVTVDYAIETPQTTVASGTLTFTAGETVKNIFGNPAVLGGATTWRVALKNSSGGEVTGGRAAYALAGQQTNAPATLIASGASWRYLDDGSDQGTAWRGTNFIESAFWSNGVAQLGFGDGDEATRIRRTNSASAVNSITTFYFRRAFTVADPSAYANLSLWMLRDDGAVVYLNGTEVFRSPTMPAAPTAITFTTFANAQGSAPPDNTIDTAMLSASLLVPGTNLVTVEMHQFDLTSSDISFDFSLTGNPATTARIFTTKFGNQWALDWTASGFLLEQADDVTGPWTPLLDQANPSTVEFSTARKFYRLRK